MTVADPANSNVEPWTAEARYMMDRLEGFARGLGLDEAATRQIIKKALADMPIRTVQER
ncbi:hypothetical protein [Methylobacterium sp. CM6257]|jgi:hypothetical protein